MQELWDLILLSARFGMQMDWFTQIMWRWLAIYHLLFLMVRFVLRQSMGRTFHIVFSSGATPGDREATPINVAVRCSQRARLTASQAITSLKHAMQTRLTGR